jgi:hypothetical protein
MRAERKRKRDLARIWKLGDLGRTMTGLPRSMPTGSRTMPMEPAQS